MLIHPSEAVRARTRRHRAARRPVRPLQQRGGAEGVHSADHRGAEGVQKCILLLSTSIFLLRLALYAGVPSSPFLGEMENEVGM